MRYRRWVRAVCSLFAQIENKKNTNKTFCNFEKKFEEKRIEMKKKAERKAPEERWTREEGDWGSRRVEARWRYNRFNRPLFIFIAFAINSINKTPQNWKRHELFFSLFVFFPPSTAPHQQRGETKLIEGRKRAYFHHALSQWLKNFFRFFSVYHSPYYLSIIHSRRSESNAAVWYWGVGPECGWNGKWFVDKRSIILEKFQ